MMTFKIAFGVWLVILVIGLIQIRIKMNKDPDFWSNYLRKKMKKDE